MHASAWPLFESYTMDELRGAAERLERCAADAFHKGDYNLGHEYYLLACQAVMMLGLRGEYSGATASVEGNPTL